MVKILLFNLVSRGTSGIIKHVEEWEYRSVTDKSFTAQIEVAYLTGVLAVELGFDASWQESRTLHDIGKTIDKSVEEDLTLLLGYEFV